MKRQKWKDMRSTLSPAFTTSKIRLMIPFIEEVVNQMKHSVTKTMEASGRDHIDIEFRDLTTRYANDVISLCAFGLKVNSHTEKNNELYETGKILTNFTSYQMLKIFAMIAYPELSRKLKVGFTPENTKEYFRNLVGNTIEERIKQNVTKNDMIHLLMEAREDRLGHDESVNTTNDGRFATVEESEIDKKCTTRVWSDDDITAQALLFFFAGFDTVAVVITICLIELALNPDVQDKLHLEMHDCLVKNNNKIDYEHIQEMVYLDMVVSETLRKWPPSVLSNRLCTRDYNLGKPNFDSNADYIIRKNESIIIPTWAIHRSPEYYPNPEKFDPERFSVENKHKINPFTFLPFGIGPRNCIGSRFALCEIKLMLAHFLLDFQVIPCEKTCLPIQLSTRNSFSLPIKGGHWLKIKPRKRI